MKNKFPGFKKCLAMMRQRDPQIQEEGFHWLLSHAGDYVPELIEEFGKEKAPGLRCWLLELIGSAKSPAAFDVLKEQLRSQDDRLRYWAIWGLKKLGSKDARTLLWQARSFTFPSREETEAFRVELDTVARIQDR
jgi:hypothetical protein